MTKVDLGLNMYLYGKFYDYNDIKAPLDEQNWDIIVYNHPFKEFDRVISSLEGFFVCSNPFKLNGNNKICLRNQMKKFEEKYEGRFIPFSIG